MVLSAVSSSTGNSEPESIVVLDVAQLFPRHCIFSLLPTKGTSALFPSMCCQTFVLLLKMVSASSEV